MKKLLPFLLIPLFLPLIGAEETEDTSSVVEQLIEATKNSGAEFIRNGKSHTPEEAAEHLQKKYEHFLKKGKIKTPEDFIEHAGTKSLMSGKHYMMRFPDGTEVKSADWLTEQLTEIRENPTS